MEDILSERLLVFLCNSVVLWMVLVVIYWKQSNKIDRFKLFIEGFFALLNSLLIPYLLFNFCKTFFIELD